MSAFASTSVNVGTQNSHPLHEQILDGEPASTFLDLLKLSSDSGDRVTLTIIYNIVHELFSGGRAKSLLFSADRKRGKTTGLLASAAYIETNSKLRVAFIGIYKSHTEKACITYGDFKRTAPTLDWKNNVTFIDGGSLNVRASRSGHEGASELTKLVASTDVFMFDTVEYTHPDVLKRLLKLIEVARGNGRVIHIFYTNTAAKYQENILDIIKAEHVFKWLPKQNA